MNGVKIMKKIIWILKQILPFKYITTYKNSNGEKFICKWRMWLGKPFCIKHFARKRNGKVGL